MLFFSYVFCSDLTFAFSVTMSTQQSIPMSQIGSLALPDPAGGTLGHYQGLALRAGTLEEATYTGGLAMEEVVGWAKGLANPPPPQLIHMHMRTPATAGWFGKKGWATHLFRELQVALPGLRAVRLIPACDTAESLLGIVATHTVGKPKPALCAIYPTTGLVHCPMRMDMIAINNYFPAAEPQANHSNLPFQWQGVQAQWWDDMGILPSHPTVPPLHHIPDITVPALHRMKGLGWYRGIAPPPPLITLEPPLRTAPLQDPPSYATANPSVKADRPAPPMARNFVDGLGYTVHGDIVLAEDCKTTWGRVEKIWGGGDQVPQHFDPVFNVKLVEEQRKGPNLPQRYQSKPSKTGGLAGALIKNFINAMQDRVPDPFEDLFEMPCSVMVSGAESGDQLPHTDVSTAPVMLPPPPP